MKSLDRILVQVMLVVALALIRAVPASAQERRFSVPDGTDFATLVEHPQVIGFEVDTSPPEPATTASIGDVHAVYPLPLAMLCDTLTDFAAHPNFMPRVAESRAEKLSDHPTVWRQRVRLAFRVLLFSSEYEFTITVTDAELAQPGRFGLRLALRNQGARDMQNTMKALY